MGKYFGTDGIRGKAYEFLSSQLANVVGQSLVVLDNELLLIAKDTRESGIMLVEAIKAGAMASGIDVIDLGVLPTPVLAYLSKIHHSIGVMVTASHNPYQDNGIKIFDSGNKLFAQMETKIERMLDGIEKIPTRSKIGKELSIADPFSEYHKLFTSIFVPSHLAIGLDLANGATCATAKQIFSAFSPSIFYIGDTPDGKNINQQVGSTHLDAIISLVRTNHLDLGFAFDGDGDRVLVVDANGTVYDGDYLIYILADYLKANRLLKHDTVVLTKMSNLGIIKALSELGIRTIQTDIGDKYVLEELQKNNYVLGGENSGHIINRTLLETGDGVLNAALILRILTVSGRSLAELTSRITMYPDQLLNLRGIPSALATHPDVQALVESIRVELGTDGKILVRASGTEPLIRIFVSASTKEIVENKVEEIRLLLESLSSQNK